MHIRDAVPADLPAITEIYAESVANGVATYELTAPSLAEMTARAFALGQSALRGRLPKLHDCDKKLTGFLG